MLATFAEAATGYAYIHLHSNLNGEEKKTHTIGLSYVGLNVKKKKKKTIDTIFKLMRGYDQRIQ